MTYIRVRICRHINYMMTLHNCLFSKIETTSARINKVQILENPDNDPKDE